MQIANIEEKNLHNFWTTWGTSIKFSGKDVTCDNIKKHKNTFLEKLKEESHWPPSLSRFKYVWHFSGHQALNG